ncbi:MAG: 50S ribosomal protein L23 [Lentisphaerae bacterium GWF2_45_14]|nr:MAG: 50S ribosomal protein L23 [Lentisphaerae bacterium GWF2_45_14]
MKTPYDIIETIIMTEKNTDLKERENKYVFKVHPRSTKIEVGKAVEKLFNVKVKAVNIINCKGKPKRVGKTMKVGHRADSKKAVVTLSEGSITVL